MINEILLVFVMTLTGLADGLRDKMNSAKYKRPNFRLPWPLLDLWHVIKKIALYAPWGYFLALFFWPDLNPQKSSSWLIGAVCALVAWKVTPIPPHWRK